MRKKILVLILSSIFCCSMFGCSKNEVQTSDESLEEEIIINEDKTDETDDDNVDDNVDVSMNSDVDEVETSTEKYQADDEIIGSYDLAGIYSCDAGSFFLVPNTGEEEEDGTPTISLCDISIEGLDIDSEEFVNLSPTLTNNVYTIDNSDYVISFITNDDDLCEAFIYLDGEEQSHILMTERIIGG